MSEHELMPAIQALERRVIEAERKANELNNALNILREDAGLPPRSPGNGGGGGGGQATLTKIQPDTFFGKKQQTAVREYLELRKAQGLSGPAKPRDIYDALVSGGFPFTAKDAETALVGLRALLRKRSNIFVKVGGGTYGLVSWYPEMRKQKMAAASTNDTSDDDDDVTVDPEDLADDDETETADAKKKTSAA